MTRGQRMLILVVCWLIAALLGVHYVNTGRTQNAIIWGGLIMPILLVALGLFIWMGRGQ
jgi:hypothetical protein